MARNIKGRSHTYASHLLSKGVPIEVISKQLGHASIVTTYRHYAGFIPAADEHQHDRIDALIDAEEAKEADKLAS